MTIPKPMTGKRKYNSHNCSGGKGPIFPKACVLLIPEQSQGLVNVEEGIGGMAIGCTTSSVTHNDIAGAVSQCKQPDFSLNFSQVYALDSLRIVRVLFIIR